MHRTPWTSRAFGAVVILGNIAAIALAADPGIFSHLDGNSDGVLSGKEAQWFRGLDQDGDQEVSAKEFEMAVSVRRAVLDELDGEFFRQRDGNEDARLSGSELSGVEYSDLDKDGRVGLDEFRAGMKHMRSTSIRAEFSTLLATLEERFKLLDANQDSRLSGRETAGSLHYDLNNDQRLTLEEYVGGSIIDIAASEGASPDPNVTKNPFQQFATVLNSGSVEQLIKLSHPNLIEAVDEVVLKYLLADIKTNLGELAMPTSDKIKQSVDAESPTMVNYEAELTFKGGPATGRVSTVDGKIIGFSVDAPILKELNARLFKDLAEEDRVLREFADFYTPQCRTLIEHVAAKRDDAAFLLFHPEVQGQLDRKTVNGFYERIRSTLGKLKTIELEAAGVDLDMEGNHEFFSVTQMVKGDKGTMLVAVRFQFIGLKAHLVSVTADSVKEDSPVDPPTPMPIDGEVEWKQLDSEVDNVSFQMPGQPKRTEDEAGHKVMYVLDAPKLGGRFAVNIVSTEESIQDESGEVFAEIERLLPESVKGEIISKTPSPWRDYPGQQLVLKLADGRQFWQRDVVVGFRLYSLQWVTSKTDEETIGLVGENFLGSFTTFAPDPVKSSPEPPAPPASDDDLPPRRVRTKA